MKQICPILARINGIALVLLYVDLNRFCLNNDFYFSLCQSVARLFYAFFYARTCTIKKYSPTLQRQVETRTATDKHS